MKTKTAGRAGTTKTAGTAGRAKTPGRLFVLGGLVILGALSTGATITGVEVRKGDNPPLGAGRIIAAQAIGSEASSPAIVSIVTPFEWEEYTTAVVTNYTYRPATSNVQYTATETLWRAFSTNAYSVATGSVVAVSYVTNVATVVTGTVWNASTGLSNLTHTVTNVVALTNAVPLVRTGITSNLLAQAWGARPYVANWNTNDLLYVSQSLTRTLSSNVTYQVVDTMDVRTNRTRNVTRKATTNLLWSVEVDGGEANTTNGMKTVIFPGDFILGEGDAVEYGRVMLLIER